MKKILFLHGLNWSGECPPALTLRKELEDMGEDEDFDYEYEDVDEEDDFDYEYEEEDWEDEPQK